MSHRRIHLALTCVWGLLVIPTIVWWKESILWVGLISCYANAAAHWAAYEGARPSE